MIAINIAIVDDELAFLKRLHNRLIACVHRRFKRKKHEKSQSYTQQNERKAYNLLMIYVKNSAMQNNQQAFQKSIYVLKDKLLGKSHKYYSVISYDNLVFNCEEDINGRKLLCEITI